MYERGNVMIKKLFNTFVSFLLVLSIAFSGVVFNSGNISADEIDDVEEYDEEDYEEYDEDDEEWDEEEWAMEDVKNFVATSIGKTSVVLKWDKVEEVDGYELSYKKASSSKWITEEIDSNSTTKFTIKKLKVNTKYNFRIRTYIYYEEDEEDYEEDDEDYEVDEEDYEEDEEDWDDEEWDEDWDEEDDEFSDYEFSEYSKMSLKTLNKKGQGNTAAYSSTYEVINKSIKAPKLSSVKSKKAKQAVIKWKKVSGATGYEVYVSKKKNSGYKKIGTLKKNTKITLTYKKLKSGTKYFFKVRAYVKVGSKYSYSKYSKVKNVKAK